MTKRNFKNNAIVLATAGVLIGAVVEKLFKEKDDLITPAGKGSVSESSKITTGLTANRLRTSLQ